MDTRKNWVREKGHPLKDEERVRTGCQQCLMEEFMSKQIVRPMSYLESATFCIKTGYEGKCTACIANDNRIENDPTLPEGTIPSDWCWEGPDHAQAGLALAIEMLEDLLTLTDAMRLEIIDEIQNENISPQRLMEVSNYNIGALINNRVVQQVDNRINLMKAMLQERMTRK